MTTATIALTIGIILAIGVVCIMCVIIVGAAADPLSQFDSPHQRTDESAVGEQGEGQGSNHFGSANKP